MIKRLGFTLSLLALSLAFHAPATAQSADKILKKAARAMGGEKSLRAVKSWQKRGRMTKLSTGASGVFQSSAAQPNFYAETFDLAGFETAAGYNGKSGWTRDSKNGLRTFTGAASRDFQAEVAHRNRRWLDYKKEKSKANAAGQANIDGKPADAVVLTTAKGAQIKMFFDRATGLLVREEIPAGDGVKIYDYADFRPVNGVQEPFSVRLENAGERYEIRLDAVVHNAQIARQNFDFPKMSDAPLPDVAALLMELQANEDRIEELLENYSYAETSTKRELGRDGVLRDAESETFQVTFYKGERIRRLTAKNGRPLSAKDQADEDKKAQRRVAEIERELEKKREREVKQARTGEPDEDGRRISVAEVLRASRLVNPRRERFRGRNVIVFDFEPNPDFDFKRAKSFLKFFGKTAGVMWIDEEDKQVARLEAFLFDNYKVGGGFLANLQKGASFTLEQDRVNDEIWLPSAADINLSVKVLLVKGINVNQAIRYGNYEKFNTEVRDSKVN